jgi:hypothetical protein
MAYLISGIECCEPTSLRVDPAVEVRLSVQPGGMCAPVDLLCADRDVLAAYLVDQWGDDESTGGWTSDVIESIEEFEPAVPREFRVWRADNGEEVWRGQADSPIEALDFYAVSAGFVPYSGLIRDQEAERAAEGPGADIFRDPEVSDHWCGYTEELLLWGIFTNYWLYAEEVD